MIMALMAFFVSAAHAQTVNATSVNASKNIKLKDNTVTDFQTDTVFSSDQKIPTSKAVKDYVLGHGGGGGGSQTLDQVAKRDSVSTSKITVGGFNNSKLRVYENNAAANADSNRVDKLVNGDEYYLPYNAGVFTKAIFYKSNIVVDLTAILQGAYRSTNMGTELVTAGYVPLSQPYNVSPFFYTGNENVGAIPANVVDWVIVELRSSISVVTATRAAFIKQDGKIVDLDGTSPVKFNNAINGNYYIAVRHRNHLGILTPTALALGNGTVSHNFTTAQTQAYSAGIGVEPFMKNLGGGKFAMWGGNAFNNTQIRYNGGPNNDKLTIIAQDTFVGYFQGDVDMNGVVEQYGSDMALLLAICGGAEIGGANVIIRQF